jgi:flagellar protein FlbD
MPRSRTDTVIMLTRLGGHPLALNPDLMERAEATPDTVITMVDGHKLVVSESVEDVAALVLAWRAAIAAKAFEMTSTRDETDDGTQPPRDDEAAITKIDTDRDRAVLARVLQLPVREE